ncbi:MAG: hypothetical protein HY821_04880 [Acidobacteria bacterium]|nr:hypothetical protein [Acidobacteriota bacterium]
MTVLNAGCCGDRNSVYFLREGYEVFEADAAAVDGVRGGRRRTSVTL